MMLEFLGFPQEARSLETVVKELVASGKTTPDLGGDMTTEWIGCAVANRLGAGN